MPYEAANRTAHIPDNKGIEEESVGERYPICTGTQSTFGCLGAIRTRQNLGGSAAGSVSSVFSQDRKRRPA
jgi:hypothetical protein